MKGMFSKTARSLVAAVALSAGLGAAPPALASEPFLGQIQTFGFNFPPRGWAHCNGQLLAISSNSALFSLIGTTFGGDGRVSFGLPDLRGRVARHVGNGPGLSPVIWGRKGGAESVNLTINHLPSHNHPARLHATSTDGNQEGPGGAILAHDNREDQYSSTAPNVTMSVLSITTANVGGGQAVHVLDPYLGIYHSIALTGIYPSRN